MEPHGLNSCRLESQKIMLTVNRGDYKLRKELDFNARGTGKIPGGVEDGS